MIAAALDVPTIFLLTPLGTAKSAAILPDLAISPREVRGWIMGVKQPPYAEQQVRNTREARSIISMFEMHHSLLREYLERRDRVQLAVRSIQSDLSVSRSDDTNGAAEIDRHLTELNYTFHRLQEHRKRMAAQGIVIPDLPDHVASASLRSVMPLVMGEAGHIAETPLFDAVEEAVWRSADDEV